MGGDGSEDGWEEVLILFSPFTTLGNDGEGGKGGGGVGRGRGMERQEGRETGWGRKSLLVLILLTCFVSSFTSMYQMAGIFTVSSPFTAILASY